MKEWDSWADQTELLQIGPYIAEKGVWKSFISCLILLFMFGVFALGYMMGW